LSTILHGTLAQPTSHHPASSYSVRKSNYFTIFRALGHNARSEPHAAAAAEPLGYNAIAFESTQIEQLAGE